MKLLLIGLIFIFLAEIVQCKLKKLVASECAGKSLTISCGDKKKIAVVYQTIFGVRKAGSTACKYTPGDCIQEERYTCGRSECLFGLPTVKLLSACQNQKANYAEIQYYCVPNDNSTAFVYDVCAFSEMTTESGIITSPGFPVYKERNDICLAKIIVPPNKSINILVLDMSLAKRDSTENCNDYLKVTDTTGTYVSCGIEKNFYVEQLCSNVVYISYRGQAKNSIVYKGFKLYYEALDLEFDRFTDCPSGTPSRPYETTTLTPATTNPVKPALIATGYYNFQICKGNFQTFDAPTDYILWIEEIFHRVTDNALCDAPSNNHCSGPYSLNCNHQKDCTFSFFSTYPVYTCGNRPSTYVYGVYRYIPIDSSVKFEIGSREEVNVDQYPNGIITSPNFPMSQSDANYVLTLKSSFNTKVLKIYITDLDTNDAYECQNNYVQFSSAAGTSNKFCGSLDPKGTYSYQTCSNNVQIKYASFNAAGGNYRGLRLYYELLDNAPSFCSNVPTLPTPSTQSPTVSPTSDEVISSVLTFGGNGNNRTCTFPFVYNNNVKSSTCVLSSDYPDGAWCSVTDNYDRDKQRGTCYTGLTSNVKFSVCKSKFKTMSCPKGYNIRLISAEGVVTKDSSCDQDKTECTQSIFNLVQTVVRNSEKYKYYASAILDACSNKPANLVLIDYDCVPSATSLPIQTFDICNDVQTISSQNALIQSSNYPTSQANVHCKIQINTNSAEKKILNIYSVKTELAVKQLNQECKSAYLTLDQSEKICGSRKPEFITSKCGTSFELTYTVENKAYNGFKIFYELKDVVNPIQCAEFQTTTSDPSVSTTKPDYVEQGIASPVLSITTCNSRQSIACPNNYVISLKSFFYGVSKDNKCFFSEGDCISYSDQNLCAGKTSCELPLYFQYLPECSSYSTYLQVEYECIPTFLTQKSMCGQTFENSNSIITSPNYPTYDTNLNCNASIKAPVGYVIKAYVLQAAIKEDCSLDSLTFSEPFSIAKTFCGQEPTSLAYETCFNRLDISLITRGSSDNSLAGVSIYYEVIPRPIDFVCKQSSTLNPITTPPFISTTTAPTATTPPTYLGYASKLFWIFSCKTITLTCPPNYLVLVRSSFYGVSSTNDCAYNPNDCFDELTKPVFDCSGKQNCQVAFISNFDDVPKCNAKATYFYVNYQCIPESNAGKPPNPSNTEFCSSETSTNPYLVESSLIIQSKAYSKFPFNCERKITAKEGFVLDVYLNSASFHAAAKDYVYMTDGYTTFKFDGMKNYARFVMKTQSNWLTMRYTANTTAYSNFQFYFQTVKTKPIVTPQPTPGQLTTTGPWKTGFAGDTINVKMCLLETKTLTCPSNYVMIFMNEYLISSRKPCVFDKHECKEPSVFVSAECAGRRECNVYFPQLEIQNCASDYANGLEYDYQCIPEKPLDQTTRTYSCESETISGVQNGFITSPQYPLYVLSQLCTIKIVPPENYGYKFYLIDVSLSPDCYDDLVMLDNLILCESEKPRFYHKSPGASILKYKSADIIKSNRTTQADLSGFKIYFEAYSLSETKPSTQRPRLRPSSFTRINKTKRTTNLYIFGLLFGLSGIACVCFGIFFSYKRCVFNPNLRIKFSFKSSSSATNETIRSFANPNLDISLYDYDNLNR